MTESTTPDVLTPVEINSILSDITGFGITDTEEIITMTVKGREVRLRLSTVSPDDEVQALIANLEIRGHAWVHQMRCDILSRSITWINGVACGPTTFATDPYLGEDRPVRAILRDILGKWGKEAVLILWKVYMVHCQRVEDSLIDQLPDSTIMTQVEARFMAQIADELKAMGVEALTDTADVASADDATTQE